MHITRRQQQQVVEALSAKQLPEPTGRWIEARDGVGGEGGRGTGGRGNRLDWIVCDWTEQETGDEGRTVGTISGQFSRQLAESRRRSLQLCQGGK